MISKIARTYAKQAVGDVVVQIEQACERKGKYTEAYSSGYSMLDNAMKAGSEKTGGFRDGDMVIITGRSGCGKTAFAQNITIKTLNDCFASLWFSYEVSINNLYAKFKEMGANNKSPIYTPKKLLSGNVKWIGEKIKEARKKYWVKMIMIDHLDFLSPTDKNTSDQFRMVLRNICQELKTLAIDQEVIIFLMAHIRKTSELKISMEDIAESAGIYQLADYVFAVERGEELQPLINGEVESKPNNKGKIRVLKNRLTGMQPVIEFKMENNIIKPYE